MQANRTLKLVTAIAESVLAIPVLGGILVLASFWSLLGVMLILHIITLILSIKAGKSKYGSIIGIVANAIGWIPVVGWIMHIATAITLWISFAKD